MATVIGALAGPLLLLNAAPVRAAQALGEVPSNLCTKALHAPVPLGQWDLEFGSDRAATLSVVLPAHRNVLLEVQGSEVDVDVEITAAASLSRAGNPIRRRAVVRLMLNTPQSGRVKVAMHAPADGGVGRRVTVRAYDTDFPQTEPCRSVLGMLVAGDEEIGQARWVSAGHSGLTPQTPSDLYAAALETYSHAFGRLDPDNVALRAEVANMIAALACEQLDQWSTCEHWAAQAAAQFRLASDPQGRANALSLQALAWMELAQTERKDSHALINEALRQFRRLVGYYLKHADPYDAADQLNLAGVTDYYTGNYDAALRDYGRAKTLFEATGERYRLVLTLQNIALADWDLGRVSAALTLFQRALKLVDIAESPHLYALVLDNAGLANRTAGHLDEALTLHAQALDLTTKIQDSSEKARSQFGIGMVYAAVGDHSSAAAFLQQALDTFTKGGEGRDSVSTVRALAMISAQGGNYSEAIRLARDALSHATGPIIRAHLLAQIADAESLLGRNQDAQDDLALAAKIPGAGDPVTRSSIRFERAVLDFRRGKFAVARSGLRTARATAQAFGLDAAAFDADVALARVDAADGHPELALRDLDAGLRLSEVLRVQVSDPELRATSMQPLRPAFDLEIDLLAATYRRSIAAGDANAAERAARAALAVAERSRARAMQDIAVADYTHGNAPQVEMLLSRKSQVLRDLAAHQDRLEATPSGSMTDPRVAAMRSDLIHLREQLSVLESQLAVAGHPDAPRSQQRATAVEIPPGTAFLSYWLGQSNAYVWLQTGSRIQLIDLGLTDALRKSADAAHAAYGDPDPERLPERLRTGAALSRLVLQPVISHLPSDVSRLFIIPDGSLHYISFAALPMSAEPHEPFLVEKYDVAYGSSVTSLLRFEGPAQPTDDRMLLVADAVYGPDDPRLQQPARARPTSVTELPRLRSAVNMEELGRLPATAVEATDITRLATSLSVDSLSGFGATREAVLSRPLERYRYIHFAVHATTDAEIPQLSSLVLSTHDAGGHKLEDRIWAGDLMTRRFSAETVVLSACQTALGPDLGGEGLFSLRYVVLARGAHSVIASLWAVPDLSTSTLMQAFYTGLLEAHRGPAAALTMAMRRMIKQGPRDPVFWAPFTATVAALK